MDCKSIPEETLLSSASDSNHKSLTFSLHRYRIRNLNSPSTVPLAKRCGRTVLNLCQGSPAPPLQVVQGFIRPLVTLLRNYDASELDAEDSMGYFRLYTARILCNISAGGEDCIQALIDSHTIPLLMTFLDLFPDNQELLLPTVRTLGNLATGNDQQLQVVIEAGFLKYADTLLDSLSVRVQTVCHQSLILTNFHAHTLHCFSCSCRRKFAKKRAGSSQMLPLELKSRLLPFSRRSGRGD